MTAEERFQREDNFAWAVTPEATVAQVRRALSVLEWQLDALEDAEQLWRIRNQLDAALVLVERVQLVARQRADRLRRERAYRIPLFVPVSGGGSA